MNTDPPMAKETATDAPADAAVAALPTQAAAIMDGISALAAKLPFPVTVACATRPLSLNSLSQIEHAYLRDLGSGPRRKQWRLGRAALARLFAADRPPPGSAGTPQQAQWSLCHTDDLAIAVATTERNLAIGVDIEAPPGPSERSRRLFLSDREQRWLGMLPASTRQSATNRLWALKEAAYKSVPVPQTVVLRDFRLRTACLEHGVADCATAPGSSCFYLTDDVAGTAVALAYCRLQADAAPGPIAKKA